MEEEQVDRHALEQEVIRLSEELDAARRYLQKVVGIVSERDGTVTRSRQGLGEAEQKLTELKGQRRLYVGRAGTLVSIASRERALRKKVLELRATLKRLEQDAGVARERLALAKEEVAELEVALQVAQESVEG